MNLKNVLLTILGFLFIIFAPLDLQAREINLATGEASEKNLTIYISEPLPFYLLEKKGWITRDILLSVWLEWARLNHASLSLEIQDNPKNAKIELKGNHFFVPAHLLPEPRLGTEFLMSSSLLRNQLSLISPKSSPFPPEGKIGILENLYPTWLVSSFSAINPEKVVLFEERESLQTALDAGQVQAMVDYPMVVWGLQNQADKFTYKPVGYPPTLNTTDESVAKAWWTLQEELLRIPPENLEKLQSNHLNLLAETDKPFLAVAMEKDYAPFSSDILGNPEGLLVDYAESFFEPLGVPFRLSFWQDSPVDSFDLHWGLKPENEKAEIFPFYETPLVLLPLQDLAFKASPRIGYGIDESYLTSFKQLYPNAQWIKETKFPAPVDAWLSEGARLPQSLLDHENKTLISQSALYQKMIPFYLGTNKGTLKVFFDSNGLDLFEKMPLLKWSEDEVKWISNPLYRTLSFNSEPLQLNEEEKLWIYHHNTLRVGIYPNGDLLESTGNWANPSLSDLFLKKMGESLNLKIQKIPVNNSTELKTLWEKGEIDVFFSYQKRPLGETSTSRFFSLWEIPLFLYTLQDNETPLLTEENLSESSLGMWMRLAGEATLDTSFGEILYFPSPDKTLQSLITRETNWIFMDVYNAQFLSGRYKQSLSPLTLRNPLDIHLNLNIQPNQPVLYTLLEKAYRSLSQTEKEKMVNDWMSTWEPKPANFWGLLLFFPVLITVLLIISVNYKSFAVKLRHRDDLNKKLQEAEKIANQASASKSEFIANISHELRTCLNGIIGMTELLKKTHLDKHQEEYFSILRSSSQTLVTIVDDLLDVSRIENRRIHIESTPFNLMNYLKGVVDNTKKMNTNTRVNILLRTFNLPSELIKGDFIRLGQILNNFLRNSLKFTESGLVKLTVSSFKRQYKKIWIEFTVEDTGIGIPEDRLSDLFEPFSQAHDDLSVKKGGVGLGLYICQSLIELMDGMPIEVKSKVGDGTTFSFKIPFQLTNLGSEQLEEYSTEDFKDKQALILEKDPSHILHLSEMLLKMGLSYKIASSSSEVLSFLQQETFDLFFVEKIFLKEDPSTLSLIPYHNYPRNKIFILSESGEPVEALEKLTEDEGFSDFLSYPYEKQEILAKLKKFFGQEEHASPSQVLTERYVFKNTKILLVEDHSINQKVLSSMLENVGIEIDLASTGAEALTLFKRNSPYDIVFMDIQLPDKNGFTITQEMRDWEKSYKKHHTPIISITAHAMHGYKTLCLEKGLDDYLSKPIFFENLLIMLKNWIPDEKQILISQEESLGDIPDIPFMPQLPYLDLPQTLSNLDLSLEEYLPILSQTYETCYEDIVVPFQSQATGKSPLEREEFARHSHSLAGILGNLGVLELSKDLKACENWALEEGKEIGELLETTAEKVALFFSALEKLGSKSSSSPKIGEII